MRRTLLTVTLAFSTVMTANSVGLQPPSWPPSFLAVWTGDTDRADSDFLAIIDAAPESPRYGQIVSTVTTSQRATNPHHTEHAFARGHMLFASGFGGNRIFRFDLSDPARPRFAGPVDNAPRLAFAHSMERLPNGNVLATMQAAGPDYGGHGGLAEFNDQGHVVRSASAAPLELADALIRPYSLAIVPKKDRIVTASSRMGLPPWDERADDFEHEHTSIGWPLMRGRTGSWPSMTCATSRVSG